MHTPFRLARKTATWLLLASVSFTAQAAGPTKPATASGVAGQAASAPGLKKGATVDKKLGTEKTGSEKPSMKSDTTPNTSGIKVPPKPKVPADKVPAAKQ